MIRGASKTGIFVVAALAIAVAAPGCIATVRPGYAAYDANQCYWSYVDDGYGGYEQLFCYSSPSASYIAVVESGSYVRRYPRWYTGQRVVVRSPRVRIVRPRGVVVRPRPVRAPTIRARGSVRIR